MGAPFRTSGGSAAESVSAYPVRPAAASSVDVNPVVAGHEVLREREANAEMRDSVQGAESGLPLGKERTSARSPVSGEARRDVSTAPLLRFDGGKKTVRPDGVAQRTDVPRVVKNSSAVSVMSASPYLETAAPRMSATSTSAASRSCDRSCIISVADA